MRFLAGMCAGVMLLLYLAGDPGGHLARGADLATGALPEVARDVARSAAEAPPEASVGEPGAADDALDAAEVVAAVAEVAETVVWPEDEPLPEAFGDDFAWWGPPEAGSDEGAVVTPDPAAGASRDAPVPVAEVEAEVAVAEVPEPVLPVAAPSSEPVGEPVGEPIGEPAAVPPVSTASVWIPFHSERSAAGFAQRLSRALEHPFDVRREGPGRYQVVFPYDDAAARDEVLARVAMITGTQP